LRVPLTDDQSGAHANSTPSQQQTVRWSLEHQAWDVALCLVATSNLLFLANERMDEVMVFLPCVLR
jgi:hypothetical protein